MNSQLSRYFAAMGLPTIAYFASVIAATLLCKILEPGALRLLAAALPLPAILWLACAELARLRRRDELRQRIEQEAMTIAFSTSFCVAAMLAFLDLFGVFKTTVPAIALVMAACWSGGQIWVRMRYRYGWLQADEEGVR